MTKSSDNRSAKYTVRTETDLLDRAIETEYEDLEQATFHFCTDVETMTNSNVAGSVALERNYYNFPSVEEIAFLRFDPTHR